MNFTKLFKQAKKHNIDEIQAELSESESINFHVFNGEMDKHQIADTKTLKLKAIIDGKMGKHVTEIIDDTLIDDWIQALIDSAKAVESEDEVFIYAGDSDYKDIDTFSESKLSKLSHQDKIDMVHALEEKAKSLDDRIQISQSFYGESTSIVTLKNSKGLDLQKRVKNAVIGGDVVAREDDDTRNAFDFIQSNDPEDFDLDAVAHSIVKRATSLLGAKSLKSGRYDILLENRASATLLSGYLGMFKAESVQKGLSKLAGKLKETVAASTLNLIDNPFMPKSTKSGGFDDEGVATQYKEIIKSGTLHTYLYDLKTAKKDNTESTGNAFGGNIAPTNLYFENGTTDVNTLVSQMKEGLLITSLQGVHSGTNAVSGDFSLQASGFLIKNGTIERPVALFTIAGNYLDMLQNVTDLGNDLKFSFSYIGSPTLKIDGVIVSGE